MMLLNGDERSFNYAFPFIYLGELSTLFLNIRTMYKALGREELWVSLCFAISFFVTRILLFGGLLVHLWREREAVQLLLGRALQVAENKKKQRKRGKNRGEGGTCTISTSSSAPASLFFFFTQW